jgi:hypothetical protein
LSPFAVYDLSQAVLGSLGTIANGKNTTPLVVGPDIGPPYGTSLVVRATHAGNAAQPLVGVPIEVSIAGNNSSVAFLAVQDVAGDSVTITRTTGPDGYADFGNVVLTKAGGYTLQFRVHFVDTSTQPDVIGPILLSNPFQIQNK